VAGAPPFDFLHETEEEKLARLLSGERPQTIALVLAHLSQKQAGKTLIRFSPQTQAEVLRRLVDLEETDPEILRDVERGLRARLSEQVQMQRRRVAGLSAVSGILEASDHDVGTQLAENLAVHDRQLAEQFSPPPIDFDDFVRVDSTALAAIVRAADPKVTVLALIGAPPELVSRMLREVPPTETARIRHHLDNPGPTRLSDVEEARRQMAGVARRLAMAGLIEWAQSTAKLSAGIAA
jgi:flagellar motor switch protein FliG